MVRRAADAITNLAHENVSIKSRVRTEGGIPPLVALLDSYDAKVLLNALARQESAVLRSPVLGQHFFLSVIHQWACRVRQALKHVCAMPQVQRAAAGALRTLAFKNEENKNQIVECGALPTLIHMLRAQDAGIHYEAVGVIGNLVHSSIHIKRTVCTCAISLPAHLLRNLPIRCPPAVSAALLNSPAKVVLQAFL